MVRKLQKHLRSPGRRTPTQEFDYRDLIEDKDFHALIEEKRQNGFFDGVIEGTAAFNSKLKIIALDFVRAENERRAALFLNRGILYAREYKIYRESISCYNRALEISRNNPSRHVTLANRAAAYLKTEEYSDALADAQEAARLSPNYAIAHSLVGYCQSQLGQLREAIVNYKLALRLNPADECSKELLEDAKRTLRGCGGNIDDIKTPEVPSSTVESYENANLPEQHMDESEPTHRRYLNSMGRVSSLKELVRKALLLHDDKDLQGVLVSVDCPPPPLGTEKLGKEKTPVRRISSLKSVAKLPGKLKRALLKKYLGTSLPEPLEVSAVRDDLHENFTKDTAEVVDRSLAGKEGNEEPAKLSPGPPHIGQLTVSKKTSARSLGDAAPSASTSSAVSTPVGDAPLVPGDAAGGSISEGDEPEKREAWKSPPYYDNPGIITSECIPFDEGNSEEKAASPETVGYNESVIHGCLPPSTPVCKEESTPPCPDRSPVSSEETGTEAQFHKTSQVLPGSERLGSVPLTALSPLDEEPMLPCSFNPQLGSMNAQEAITSTHQPSPTPQSNRRAAKDNQQVEEFDASYLSGTQQCIVRLRRDEELDALLMDTSQKLAWTSFEASNESRYSECESSDDPDAIKFGIEEGVATVAAEAASLEAEMYCDGLSGLHNGGEDRLNDANIQSQSDSNHSVAPGLINLDALYTVDVPAAIEKNEGKRVLPSDS